MLISLEAITAFATAASAFFAAVAAGLSVWAIFSTKAAAEAQRVADKANAAEQRAADYVKSYFELVVAHPDMWASSKRYSKQEQYESFLAYTLAMAQQVLAAHPKSEPWRKFVEEQIKFNEDELESWSKPNPDYFDIYGSEVSQLVRERLSQRRAGA